MGRSTGKMVPELREMELLFFQKVSDLEAVLYAWSSWLSGCQYVSSSSWLGPGPAESALCGGGGEAWFPMRSFLWCKYSPTM